MNVELFPSDAQLCGAKILIVDDESADVRLLEWTLRLVKFANIRTMTDSAQALDAFKEFQPDLVLLNLDTPKIDGLMILKEIQKTTLAGDFLPVLVLTGFDAAEIRSKATAAGASDFLGKPIDCTKVMLRIRNLLRTRFLHRLACSMQKQLATVPILKPTPTGNSL